MKRKYDVVADIQNAVDAHEFNGFAYFGGTRPVITREFLQGLKFADPVLDNGRDSWAVFFYVNDIDPRRVDRYRKG